MIMVLREEIEGIELLELSKYLGVIAGEKVDKRF